MGHAVGSSLTKLRFHFSALVPLLMTKLPILLLHQLLPPSRKMAMLLHPDKTGVEGAQEAFKLLGQARNVILKTFRE